MFLCLRGLIFLIPFAFSLGAPAQSLVLGSWYLVLLLVFLALWILFEGLSLKTLRSLRHPLIFFIFALTVAVIFSDNLLRSYAEIPKYAVGLLLFLTTATLPEKKKTKVVQTMLLAGFLIGCLAVYQYFFGFDHLREYLSAHKITDPFVLETVSQKRVFFPFMTPNILGGYLAMILPLSFNSKKRALIAAPILLALFFTKSLSALLSLAVVFAVLSLIPARSRKRSALTLSLLVMIFVCIFILRTNNPKQHLLPAFSVMARLNYWKDAWEIIRAHPLTGIGLGNFALPTSYYAHHSYLQLWAEAGPACILSFLWLITAVFQNALKKLQGTAWQGSGAGLFAGACIFLVHNTMDFSFFLPAVSFIWWIMLGLLYSPRPEKSLPAGS